MQETKTGGAQDFFLVFRDMLLYVLLRWRSILAVALVLAVVAGGYKYMKDLRHYQSLTQMQAGETEPEEPDTASKAKITAVLRYRAAYEGVCHYNANALLMQIDSDSVPTRNISYLIAGERAYAAAEMYRKYLADDNLYTAITGQLTQGDDPLPVYLAELVTTTIEQDDSVAAPSVTTPYLLLNIRVVAPTEALCGQIATVVKDSMHTLPGSVRELVGEDLSCERVYDQYGVRRITAIRDQQQKSLSSQADLETKLADAEDALTAAEREYIDRKTSSEDEEKPAPAKPSISKKWLVLGFLGGGVLMVLWYVLRYLVCARVQSRTDMTLRYAFPVFGTVAAGGKKGFFLDRWLKAWLRDKNEALPLVQRQVLLAARHGGVKQVFVTGTGVTADTAALSGLETLLAEQGIGMTVGGYPTADAAAMDAMAAADALLLVETVGVSSHKELARVLEVSDQCGQTVLGAVLMQ